jgi:hypothetical protein
MYKHAEEDALIDPAANPARKVEKPRRLPSTRRAVAGKRLAEINHTAATTGDDPELDTLLLRLHTETACRRGGALALRPQDLDPEQCLILLREKGETVRWQPVSPTLMAALLGHAGERNAPAPALGADTYPGILIAASADLVILDAGPVSFPLGAGPRPAWCEALVQVPGWAHPLRAYSVDLPARSSTEQRSQADHLASRIASLGELAIAGGNWNSYSRADAITAATLEVAPLHLRPARMRYTPQDQTLGPNYDVHDVVASVGLHDAVAVGAPGTRGHMA